MSFSPEQLESVLQSIPDCSSAVVGLSGGLDSIVLLHALSELRANHKLGLELRALHINHGLQADADAWQQLCQTLCEQLAVPFRAEKIELKQTTSTNGEGMENAARQARYQVFEAELQRGEALLLAHHRDDQMETLLLRLMRGSGSRGMSGIPLTRKLGQGCLFRPLLSFDRAELQAYAQRRQLHWAEDQSNRDTSFDRNYCRHQLLPLIEARWPGYRDSWSKTATLAAEAESLLADLAALDLAVIAAAGHAALKLEELQGLASPRRRNLLRHWLDRLGLPDLGWNRLQQLSEELVMANDDSQATIVGDGFQLTRFKHELLALRLLTPVDTQSCLSWQPGACARLDLPDNGYLQAQKSVGEGIRLDDLDQLQLRYRQGGENCRLAGRPGKSLKKLLQEHQVPPWLRDRLPLVYAGDELICIPGIGVSEQRAAASGEPGIVLEWQPPSTEID